MIKKLPQAAVAVLCSVAAQAMADPGPDNGQPGAYYSVDAELEFNLSDELTDELLGGRIDARAGQLNPGNGALQFGFEVGVDAYDIPGSPHLIAWQAIGYLVSDFGTFSLGVPIAAGADFGPDTVFDRTVINTVTLNNAMPTAENLIRGFADPVPGARYDRSFGSFSVALSYHEFTRDQDLSAISGAASYDAGVVILTGELGYLERPTSDVHTLSLAAEGSYGPLGGSFEYLSIDGTTSVYTLEGTYDVTDQLSVAAGLREFDFSGGGPDTSWLLEAEYGFGNGAYVSATAGRTVGNGEAAVGVGLEF